MSAFGGKADMAQPLVNVRFWHKADIAQAAPPGIIEACLPSPAKARHRYWTTRARSHVKFGIADRSHSEIADLATVKSIAD